MHDVHSEVVRDLVGVAAPPELMIDSRPLCGGLEAESVELLTCSVPRSAREFRCVVKYVTGAGVREIAVYDGLLQGELRGLAPELLAVRRTEDGAWLYLEEVRCAAEWPWADTRLTRSVLAKLARLHEAAIDRELLRDWNYELELEQRASATLELLGRERRTFPDAARTFRSAKRLVSALPRLREQLFATRFGKTWIHGDMHTGNVLVREAEPGEAVLIDWGRSRLGSPFEDVSSWLQSLRCWEPDAERRHDRLLTSYLQSRGYGAAALAECRPAYWLSAACNVLAGALLYHLWHASETGDPASLRAVQIWSRIVRRADAFWS